ncbi:MAG: nucleoside hydrolase [Firmicutes bacterium]|nr:nucleoside hydrolase [Bacillota bacterium]
MKNLKKLTLLHSNDMHGDFLAENVDENLVGGISLLSGYVSRARREDENVVYAIAGDMFRGSIIDSEFQGISTIQIMNMLGPDVVTVGNHEVDYGVAHLLFLEKCAEFPIINANLHITTNGARLFKSHYILEIDGMKILFIGIITDVALAQCKSDGLIGSFVKLEDAAEEIGRICNTYNAVDIDFTVLLTHIGFEEDKALAAMLDPAWGVDVIIGGHSHTFLTEPAVVNGIPIVQAGTGTDQIGRFDILIDTDNNCIDSYKWTPVPINDKTCPRDTAIEELIHNFKSRTDDKYGRILTKFVRQLTHPDRFRETELGDLFSDILRDAIGADIFLLGSGSIRNEQLGPVVTLGDLRECFPYDDPVHLVYATGAQLRHMLLHMCRDGAFAGEHTEFYQLSSGLYAEYDQESHSFLRFEFNGEPIADDRVFSVGLQHFHYKNMSDSFDITQEELKQNHPDRVVSTSCIQIIEEVLSESRLQDAKGEGRLVLHLLKDKKIRQIPVILDTDPGVDDTLAMKMAFADPRLDVRLVCSVAGNVNLDLTTANSLFLTKEFGGDIPVAKGNTSLLGRKTIDASGIHGQGGIGNYMLPGRDYKLDERDAVTAIYETLCASEEKICLVTFGPLTNIAMLLQAHPDAAEHIERLYAMITSKDGSGNITDYAEFNAYCDPEALDAVIKSGIEIIFAPMHLGRDAKLSYGDILERSEGTPFGGLLRAAFEGYKDEAAGEGYVAMYDANAVAAVLHPDLYEFVRCTPSVNTTDKPGQTFLTPDEKGKCFYLEIKDRPALAEAMLTDMFGKKA